MTTTSAVNVQRVISYYKLTEKFRRLIEQSVGSDIDFVTVGHLRNLGPLRFYRATKNLRASQLFVAAEDDSARAIVGPLLLLSALSGSRKIAVIWPDGTVEPVGRSRLAKLLASVAHDQFASRLAYWRAKRETNKAAPVYVGSSPRGEAAPNHVLYMDANLSFGLVAGGSVGHTKGVIDAFAVRGFNVDYASVKPIPTNADRTRGLQIASPSLFSFPAELNYYSFAEEYERQVERFASKNRYTFLYQRMSLHNISGVRLKRRLNLPLVLEYNGSEAWGWQNWANKLFLSDAAFATEHASLRGADLVVTVSEVLANEVRAAGVPSERIVYYPNCIDPNFFDPARFSSDDQLLIRRKLGIAEDAQVWTFIGTFGTWHGVDFLAKTVADLLEKERGWLAEHRMHFLFVGDGPKMETVREYLKAPLELGFATLAGLVPQSEAAAYLAASDGFLSPHLPNPDGTPFFGSPTKLFEYMAMERPIVASDLEQIGAVLRDERDNIPSEAKPLAELFEPGNPIGFIDALKRIVNNPARAQMMARRARQETLRHYTWSDHVAKILERMEQLGLIENSVTNLSL
jgi:glycosyltransferase involved in cell wall biosynthesis